MELNRKEIIRALEHCIKDNTCEQCPYSPSTCHIQQDALALIKELTQAEEMLSESYDHLEKTKDDLITERLRLTEENDVLYRLIGETLWQKVGIKANTVRKMHSEIKERCIKGGIFPAFVARTIEEVAKEMLEGG
jgi:hypothetical protein